MNLPIFSWFFIAGTIILIIGVLWNVSIWLRGRHSWGGGLKGIISTVFSRRILSLLRAFFIDILIQPRLWKEDKLRWLMKELIIFGYIGVIVVNEIKASSRVPGVHEITGGSHFLNFFVSPFSDYYYFRDVGQGAVAFTSLDALYGFLNDLFAGMVLTGEGIAIYRRFGRKAFILKTTTFEVVSVMLLGGWFFFRLLAESVSMLAYNIPADIGGYWFIAWALSKPLSLLQLPWESLTTFMWAFSAFLMMLLFGSIPFNTKLWHIFMTPLVTMINSVPHNPRALEGRKSKIGFNSRQLMEIDACMKCQMCADACQVTSASQKNPDLRLYYSYAGVHKQLKAEIRNKYGPNRFFGAQPPTSEEQEDFQFEVFNCLLCGRCREVCPAYIDTRQIGITNRENLFLEGRYSKKMDPVIEAEKTEKNVASFPNADRAMWVDFMPEPPEDMYQKEHADVIYFVGCIASFSPAVQDIPGAFVEILERTGIDFTIMGEEEWCCGYPLIVAGMKSEIEDLKAHNIEAVKKIGAKTMVFSCPSCYHTFRHEYDSLEDVEMFHHTQYLKKIIEEGTLELKEDVDLIAAYHDPCDLARNSGIYEEPRAVIEAIPGLKQLEFPDNREMALCCGGGGDIEILDPDLSTAVSMDIIVEAGDIEVDTIITACQQCKRVLKGASLRSENKPRVIDICEVVLQAMGEKP
ncbi:MAG: heterodisulfide reductase-related iron-sulfur binding cluster [Thermoleophilia bacterium]|nr:heterodisulfide reductase-related iron-sulfur binding cluster [Thermoleophilia bacterium]